jgi:drug/metabolite transporter (DMT)-like permease
LAVSSEPSTIRARETDMLPHVLLFATVVIWGWTFVATKILVAEIGPVEIYALRMAIGLPFLCGVLLLRRVPLRFDRGDARPLLLGGALFTLHLLIQISGLKTTTATNTGWIIAVTPLVLAVLSFLFLRERIGWNGVAGIAVATTGIVLLVSRGHVADLRWLQSTGDWLVLTSAHTWALYTVATRGILRRRDPLAVTLAIFVVAAVFAAILFVATGDLARVRALSPRGIVAVLYLAVLGQALGLWFWQIGVARLGAARAGMYLYFEPLATVALAVPVLGEPLHPFVAIGGGLVLAGVYVAQRRDPRGSPAASSYATE